MAFRDARDIADALRAADRRERESGVEKLLLVAELAEQYELEEDSDLHPALRDEELQAGGPGTPYVSEYLALELGPLLGIPARKATTLIGQVLYLKHHCPSLWAGMQELRIDVDRALHATRLCWALPAGTAERVTAVWLRTQDRLSWGAAFSQLERLIAYICPEIAEEQERRALEGRQFFIGQPRDGVADLHAQLDPIDARFLQATVDQMADILAQVDGDEDSKQLRRVKALGVLAHPALALAMQQQALQQPLVDIGPDPVPDTALRANHHEHEDAPLPAEPPFDPWEASGTADAAGEEPATETGRRRGRRGDPHFCLGHACGRITHRLEDLRPQVTIHIHINAADVAERRGHARIEKIGDVTLATLRELMIDKQVIIQPVIDLPDLPAQDGYQPSARMREAVYDLFAHEPFPFSTTSSRSLDVDHTVAYQPTGPPGQTGVGNLAPLSRRLHRAKTAGHWKVDQPEAGTLIWQSPLGFKYRVHHGYTDTLDDAA